MDFLLLFGMDGDWLLSLTALNLRHMQVIKPKNIGCFSLKVPAYEAALAAIAILFCFCRY